MTAMLSLSLAKVNCSSTDVYDEGTAQELKVKVLEENYKEVFVQTFGAINPDHLYQNNEGCS